VRPLRVLLRRQDEYGLPMRTSLVPFLVPRSLRVNRPPSATISSRLFLTYDIAGRQLTPGPGGPLIDDRGSEGLGRGVAEAKSPTSFHVPKPAPKGRKLPAAALARLLPASRHWSWIQSRPSTPGGLTGRPSTTSCTGHENSLALELTAQNGKPTTIFPICCWVQFTRYTPCTTRPL
jgi:hypothetical protein